MIVTDRSQSRRADHGTGEEVTAAARSGSRAARAWAGGCRSPARRRRRPRRPPPRRRSRPRRPAGAPAAPARRSRRRHRGVRAGRETPDAPFRQLAPPARPGADLQAAEAEALQAEERPRGDAGRVPRPAAGGLQPDDQDGRRRQPARPRRAGRSDRAHARRGDEDAQRARHRRPGRVAGRDAVDRQHLGRVERQPVDAEPGTWTRRWRCSPTSS